MSEIFEGGEFWGFAFFSKIGKFNSRKIYSKNPSSKTLPSYVIWTFLHSSLKNNIFHVDFFICVVEKKKTALFDTENQFLSFEKFSN